MADWRLGLRRADGIAVFATRVSLVGVGLGALVFGALAFVDLLGETPPEHQLAHDVLFSLVIGLPVLLGVLAFLAPEQIVRRLATLYSQFYLVSLLAWAVWGEPGVDPHGEVWILSITAIPSASAMVGQPRPRTWAYLPAMGVLTTAVAIRTSSSPHAVWEGLLTGLYAMTFGALFVGAVFVALVWTQRLDARLALEARQRSESLAAHARGRERARFEALVHDSVISTLLVAGRNAAPPDALARQAQSTLSQLAERVDEGVVGSNELSERVRIAAESVTSGVTWRESVSGELDVAPSVADAVVGAVTEAVRNAQLHAGQRNRSGEPITISVDFDATEESIRVVVRDDGRGFEPGAVSAARMGIRGSIHGRMRAVGGESAVESWPEWGSRVSLFWSVNS